MSDPMSATPHVESDGRTQNGRPRISLLSLFLLMALVAASAAAVVSWRSVLPLRAEIERLKREKSELSDASRELVLTHRDRLHAINRSRVDGDEDLWRLWVPPGRSYRLRLAPQATIGGGVVEGGASLDLPVWDFGNEVDVQLRIDSTNSPGGEEAVVARLAVGFDGERGFLPDKIVELAFDPDLARFEAVISGLAVGLSVGGQDDVVKRPTWSFTDRDAVVLKRYCLYPDTDSLRKAREASDWQEKVRPGLMLWLEPVTAEPAVR